MLWILHTFRLDQAQNKQKRHECKLGIELVGATQTLYNLIIKTFVLKPIIIVGPNEIDRNEFVYL